MRRTFLAKEIIIHKLREGCEIYTERGDAPYRPLYFKLWSKDGKALIGNIHPSTIQSLIKDGIIHPAGSDRKYQFIKK